MKQQPGLALAWRPTPGPSPPGEGSLMTTAFSLRSAPLSRRGGAGGGAPRLGLLLLFIFLAGPVAHAQRLLDFAYADSLTQALAAQGRWAALDSVGRQALALGTDYPALRRRLGAGALASGRPAAAQRHYGVALRANPLDSAARAGLVASYLAFGQVGPAALLAAGLPDSVRRALRLAPHRAITYIELEGSTIQTDERRRGAAGFGRLGVSSRLSPRLSLSQSVSYYHQDIELARHGYPGQADARDISQSQYQALLLAQLAPRWQVKAGYHYISQSVNHLGYLALAYARPALVVQAGLYAGTLTDTARVQADVRLTVFPGGRPGFYGFGRGSVVGSAGRAYPNFLAGAGGRLRPWLWAEAWGSAGRVPVLAEADGTYVYNLFDTLGRRAGASLLILGPQRLSLRLSGIAERRLLADYYPTTYTLYSLTARLAWTW
ncbi:hypothetical protein [Hymenobacter cheonanensis]|uniref:hypothetical protein n=1 Tax=Hymenobacter sp. CA2-7 TaxID=3063993 RepID=UPI0027142E5F|nr:hypothetical protein [Hymenobacter sp. CA2-7]MDO7884898.1 hypothetical protein [Hymenobacter sp. CA2-7]